jgi:hypothetical protein
MNFGSSGGNITHVTLIATLSWSKPLSNYNRRSDVVINTANLEPKIHFTAFVHVHFVHDRN